LQSAGSTVKVCVGRRFGGAFVERTVTIKAELEKGRHHGHY
jgi:hypothetical protein